MPADPAIVPCFVCGKTLDRVGDVPTQAHGGLTFVATGNFGSRIYDPFHGGARLHIIVCDECAQDRVALIVAVEETTVRPKFSYRKFESFDDFKEEVFPDD